MNKKTKNFIIETVTSTIVAATSFYAGVKAYETVQDAYEDAEKKNDRGGQNCPPRCLFFLIVL